MTNPEFIVLEHAYAASAAIDKKNPAVATTIAGIARGGEGKDERILALLTILVAEQMNHEEQFKELHKEIKRLNATVCGD